MTDPAPTQTLAVPPPSKRLGSWMSMAMVVGTMIGSGIYLLPATLAPYGPNIVLAFAVTIAGTMCLAIAFARLSARIPGGPFAYVQSAFGETPAFLTLWSYLISQWTGVAAVSVAVAGAIGFVIPAAGSGVGLTITALGTILILTLVNLTGARSAGWVQLVATLIKVIPLFAVVVLVAIRFGGGEPVEPLATMPIGLAGIAAAAALMLFSLTGFESATVVANVTENSTDTVPRATIFGTGFTGLIYLTATVATLLLLPSAIAAKSGAPFADAIAPILGHGAGALVAIIAAISAFGTCNALLLLSAEVGRSIAGRQRSAALVPPYQCRRCTDRILAGRRHGRLVAGARQFDRGVRPGLCFHRLRLDRRQPGPLRRLCRRRAQAEGDGRRDDRCNARLYLCDRDVRRCGTGGDPVGAWTGCCRPSDPLPVETPQFRCDQPGGGGRSSRASGINRRSFCANDRRHTSLVPSGPAM